MPHYTLPDKGLDAQAVLHRLNYLQQNDWGTRDGRLPLHCYFASESVDQVSSAAYRQFANTNALAPRAFPSCQQMEIEVVSMVLALLRGDANSTGSITSGGTESIILALKAARDQSHARGKTLHPNIVIPESAHPAFDKGAHLLGLKAVRVPTAIDLRCDVAAMEAAMDADTILLAGSAPSLPFGLVDRLEDLSDLALRRDVWLHVDACIGGLLAPFVRELGYPMPSFDFALPGVRSMSADLHKFGYTAKGASLVLYRQPDDHQFQFSHFSDWPKGQYFTSTLAGTRSGGPIASAWAVMHHLGHEGYLAVTCELMALRERFLAGFAQLPELSILCPPDLSVIAVACPKANIFAVCDQMAARGWYMSLVARPPAIQQTVSLVHRALCDTYFSDLRASLAAARRSPVADDPAQREREVVTY